MQALEKLDDFIKNYSLLSNELRLTARALLANQQGGRVLEQMFVSPQQPLQCRSILSVVVHAVAVFFGRQKVEVLVPFLNMLKNPAVFNVLVNYSVFVVVIFVVFFTIAIVSSYNARRSSV